MRNRYQMPGAHALFGALGGQTAEQAKNAELDRLSKLDLQRSQMGLYDARAEAERADVQQKQAAFDAQQKARNLRMDPNFLAQVVGMRVPEVAPTDVNAIVKRGMGGPFELPQIDPMNRRLIGETLAGLFAGGAADAPTNAEQMAKVVSGAGSSAQRLQAPSIAASDPITAAFMLNAGTDKAAPSLYGALPGGLGTFGTLTGGMTFDPGMKNAAVAKSLADAGKSSYDAERGGIIDWTTGQLRPLTTPDGTPVGPKPVAAAAGPRPTYDPTRGVVVDPATGTARPVTMDGGAPLPEKPKPLPPAALRMQQEEMDAIGIAAGIEADLGKVDEQLAAGKLSLGPVENWKSRAQNWAGASSENSRNFASMTATLEKLRNDSLRLNKGVQTEGDAVRAWNELMANQNDPQLVRQRIAEIRAINRRAVDLRQMNIDAIRQNYGAGPLDTTKIRNLPAAVGARPDTPQTGGGLRTHDGYPALRNEDGSYSTELSITVTDPRLNGGAPTNIPSLWRRNILDEGAAIEEALKSGRHFESFPTIDAAVRAAVARSAAGGAAARTIRRTGTAPDGRKVVEYSDGTLEYAQ